MKSFRAVISCDYPIKTFDTDGKEIYKYERQYFPLDIMKERTISAKSTIATHPLLNGDTIADHMYRNPNSFKVSGKFSLNGRNMDNMTYQNLASQQRDRLAAIEEVFEFIKDNGLLCTITTVETEMDREDSSDPSNYENLSTRYKTRHSMALESINWTEDVNTLGFSFDFKEIISIELDELEIDITNADLPCLTSPKASNLGTVLAESGSLATSVMQILKGRGYIEDAWLRKIATIAQAYAGLNLAAIIAVAAALLIKGTLALASIGATIGATSAIFPVGTIVAIAAVAVVAIAAGIKALVDKIKKNKKASKVFKMIGDNYQEALDRMEVLLNKIGQAVNKTTHNLLIYGFPYEEDEDDTNVNLQYCISVGGEYYYITIISTNEAPFFEAKVYTSLQGGDLIPDKQMYNNWCPVTNINKCDSSNVWFKDSTKEYRVYLVNPSLSDEVNATKEKKLAVMPHLKGYTIWVVKGSINDQLKVLNDTILEQLDTEGYKK